MKVEKCFTRKLLAKAAETVCLTITQNKQVTTEFNSSKLDEPAKAV